MDHKEGDGDKVRFLDRERVCLLKRRNSCWIGGWGTNDEVGWLVFWG